jgi:hypothetical protein
MVTLRTGNMLHLCQNYTRHINRLFGIELPELKLILNEFFAVSRISEKRKL